MGKTLPWLYNEQEPVIVMYVLGFFIKEKRKAMPLHIVLVEPQIPPNTGNIARSCAATDTKLHLVGPLGFSISEKAVKRAGLDYWKFVDLEYHESLNDFLKLYEGSKLYLATTKGKRLYTEIAYKDGDMIVFGKETAGLPKEFIEAHSEETIRIPMSVNTRSRSYNLSNSANIVMFEALRQMGFPCLR
jgi:tRNA (cytidine/uridine-2'-O-)-methyltransferase